MTPDTLQTFVDDLAAAQLADDAYNEYAPPDANNAIRRANLLCYLAHMAQRRPNTLLVMEAPGYRGCRLTGVPVTSRRILLEGVPELAMFGEAAGYRDVDDAGFETIQGEQSATILWETLRELGKVPLIWNTFPFHPHRAGEPRTNRKPRKDETALGADFLRAILQVYKPEVIIAVGNVAYDTMTGMGVNCVKVRHPAQGGKNDFVAGMTALLT